MRKFRALRLMLLALFVSLVPALSFGEVFISVNFAPPVLPVYEQPVCPQDGWMWTPGYWAFDYDANDYYWVPGAWVPAPEVGVLWTPGYWGFENAVYVWHPGYWGEHVGYYGGVNYGFGYMGIGFAGGEWRGGFFAYNTAVVHVDTTIVHTTYIDRTIVERNTVVNDNHVAFSGGPGGVNHPPTTQESVAMHEPHVAATTVQTQHEGAAMQDKTSFSKANGGHPANVAVARPMTVSPASGGGGVNGQASGTVNYNASKSNTGNETAQPAQRRATSAGGKAGAIGGYAGTANRPSPSPTPAGRPAPAARPAPAPAPAPQAHPAPRPDNKDR